MQKRLMTSSRSIFSMLLVSMTTQFSLQLLLEPPAANAQLYMPEDKTTLEQRLEFLYEKMQHLVKEYFPRAKFSVAKQSLHFEDKCRAEVGYYSGRRKITPQDGGVLGDLALAAGVYRGLDKDRLPSEEYDGFHTVLTMAPYFKQQNNHLLIVLSLPNEFPLEFKERFVILVKEFSKHEETASGAASTQSPTGSTGSATAEAASKRPASVDKTGATNAFSTATLAPVHGTTVTTEQPTAVASIPGTTQVSSTVPGSPADPEGLASDKQSSTPTTVANSSSSEAASAPPKPASDSSARIEPAISGASSVPSTPSSDTATSEEIRRLAQAWNIINTTAPLNSIPTPSPPPKSKPPVSSTPKQPGPAGTKSQTANVKAAPKPAGMLPIKLPPQDQPYQTDLNGTQTHGVAKLYSCDGLYGGWKIRVDAHLVNSSPQEAHYAIYVAFFNRAGILMAAGGRSAGPIQSGKHVNCELEVQCPASNLQAITHFQITYIDAPQAIGQ